MVEAVPGDLLGDDVTRSWPLLVLPYEARNLLCLLFSCSRPVVVWSLMQRTLSTHEWWSLLSCCCKEMQHHPVSNVRVLDLWLTVSFYHTGIKRRHWGDIPELQILPLNILSRYLITLQAKMMSWMHRFGFRAGGEIASEVRSNWMLNPQCFVKLY